MSVFPIRDENDLEQAFDLIDRLWGAAPGTPDGDALDIMLTLVEVYEAKHHAVPPAPPREVILFRMKELGWSQRELARQLGWGSGRVSEVLSGRRGLTVAMVQRLSEILKIRQGLLLGDAPDPSETITFDEVVPGLRSRVEAAATNTGATVSRWLGDAAWMRLLQECQAATRTSTTPSETFFAQHREAA